jgi:hypothetical protein
VEYCRGKDRASWTVRLRNPFSGALNQRAHHVSLVVFVLFMLSSTTYDSLHDTSLFMSLFWSNSQRLLRLLWGTDATEAQDMLMGWYLFYRQAGLLMIPFVYFGIRLDVVGDSRHLGATCSTGGCHLACAVGGASRRSRARCGSSAPASCSNVRYAATAHSKPDPAADLDGAVHRHRALDAIASVAGAWRLARQNRQELQSQGWRSMADLLPRFESRPGERSIPGATRPIDRTTGWNGALDASAQNHSEVAG